MIGLALVLLAAQASEPTREERVLELLARIQRDGSFFYHQASFVREAASIGSGAVVLPRVLQLCGNSERSFDAARARALGLELCGIYGLPAERDAILGASAVRLDGLAPAERVGFELRDSEPSEPGEAVLDADRLAALAGAGYRVHVADARPLRILSDDDFTPTLAWLAGLTRFLNESTEGADVELGGLLFARESSWWWPIDPSLTGHPHLEVSQRGEGELAHHFVLDVRRPTELALSCGGLADLGPPPFGSCGGDEPGSRCIDGSTAGAPSVLLVRANAHASSGTGERPEVRLRLRQPGAGIERVRESRTFALFLPSEFDLAAPFVLELELAPGRYSFHGPVRLGAADLERTTPAPR